jgi:hypothetical protein
MYIPQHTIVDRIHGSMQTGCCVLWSDKGNQVNIFYQMPPQKRNRWGLDLGTAEASLSVLLDRSTDQETFHQLNNDRDARSVVVHCRAGTTCVLWWPEERPPAVPAVIRQ